MGFITIENKNWLPVIELCTCLLYICSCYGHLFTRCAFTCSEGLHISPNENFQIFHEKYVLKICKYICYFFLIIFTPRITTARFRHIDLFTEFLDQTNALFSCIRQLDGCILCPELLRRKWLLVGHTRLNVFLGIFWIQECDTACAFDRKWRIRCIAVLIASTSMATLQFPAWSMFILFILHVFCDAWSIDLIFLNSFT